MNDLLDLKDLLLKVSEGDQDSFKKLYLHYYDRLFQLARRFMHSQEIAEEIVSDVFYNLWKNRSVIVNITYFETYIYHSVRNGCGNMAKSYRYRKIEYLEDSLLDVYIDHDSPDTIVQYNELNMALNKAVNALPERCRTIFKMAKEDNLHQQVIADILDITLSTVENQLAIATRKIKQALLPFLEEI